VSAAADSPPKTRTLAPALHFLHWGQVVVDADGARLVTVVGSCIAVCLWDRSRRVGGMNHYLLPEAPHVRTKIDKPWSYGELALPELLSQMTALGPRPHELVARVFGGAAITGRDEHGGPGPRNVRLARTWLAEHAIAVVQEDLGGRRGRKLSFDTRTGEVTVQLL
jgi:chemotaxis protein CheD